MRFTLSSILLAGAGIFFSVVANAAEPTKIPFTLRAWHNWRDTSVPLINHYVELDTAGNAIINQTAGYQGFNSYLDPTPRGTLHAFTGENGYFQPVHYPGLPASPRHYQLKYTKGIPKIAGVLYNNFTFVGRDCGGNCGGSSLDYDLGTGVKGEWYLMPVESGSGRRVWTLRWMEVLHMFDALVFPPGSITVFLWIS